MNLNLYITCNMYNLRQKQFYEWNCRKSKNDTLLIRVQMI